MLHNPLFKRAGWFYRPSSFTGWAIWAIAAIFCVTVFVAIDRHSHSASDTLYGVFPYVVSVFLILEWMGRNASE